MKKLLFLICFAALPLFADPLSGNYKVKGYDPYLKENYSGKARIEQIGENVYSAFWELGDPLETYTGTGFRDANSLIFVFKIKNDHGTKLGLQTYAIKGNTLSGDWIYYDGKLKGKETLEKVNEEP